MGSLRVGGTIKKVNTIGASSTVEIEALKRRPLLTDTVVSFGSPSGYRHRHPGNLHLRVDRAYLGHGWNFSFFFGQKLTSAEASAKVSSRQKPGLRVNAVTNHSIEFDLSTDTFTPMLGESTSGRWPGAQAVRCRS